jgi:hypothetical protein
MANHEALQKHKSALQRVNDHAMAIYSLLDSSRGPVKIAQIKQALKINDQEYRRARQHLTTVVENVYITMEGLVLREHVNSEDQRLWHLAWCLGLLEVSGNQLAMDEDLLERAPGALIKMLSEGKLKDHKRLSGLQESAKKRVVTILKLAEMYRRVDKALGLALLSEVTSKDWHDGLRQIRNQIRNL